MNKKVALGMAFSGRNIGGVRRYMENIEKKSKHFISLFPSYDTDNLWKQRYDMEIRRKFLEEIYSLKDEIINNHDVFHTNVDPTFIKIAEEAQKKGKLWVHTYHSIYMKEYDPINKLQDWQIEINNTLLKVAKKADIKLCVSPWLVDFLNDQKIESIYLPNFIDLEYLNNANSDKFFEKYKLKNFILFIGDANINKNYIEFLKAALSCKDYNFVLIGTDLTKENIELKNNIKLPNNIFALGPLSHKDCLDAALSCSVLVMNSFTEGLPTVLIESMTYSKPCIIPDGPIWSKYLFDNNEGYKYKLGDTEELLFLIKNIMKNYKEKPEAREYVLNNFSSKKIINKIDNIYKFGKNYKIT